MSAVKSSRSDFIEIRDDAIDTQAIAQAVEERVAQREADGLPPLPPFRTYGHYVPTPTIPEGARFEELRHRLAALDDIFRQRHTASPASPPPARSWLMKRLQQPLSQLAQFYVGRLRSNQVHPNRHMISSLNSLTNQLLNDPVTPSSQNATSEEP